MTTVAVVGAGEIGGAAAQALATRHAIRRIVLIDANGPAAAGKALDIQQAGAIAGHHAQLSGSNDTSRAIGCAACVVADRFGSTSDEGLDSAVSALSSLAAYLGDAPIVLAGAGRGDLIETAVRELGLNRRRLIGSAPEAIAGAARALVALEAECSATEVSLSVLGRPPQGLIIAWSNATIAGHALDHVLHPSQIARIDARVTALWPPGPFALGLSAARVTSAILTADRRSFPVLGVLDGEFGIRRSCGIVPAILGRSGIVRTWEPPLTTRERVGLTAMLDRESVRER